MIKTIVQILLVTALATLGSEPAKAVSYTTGGAIKGSIGDEINWGWDVLALSAVSAEISDPGTYLLNNVTFTVGPNCYTCAFTTGSVTENLTIGGDRQTITVNYNWVGGAADTLNLLASGPYHFAGGWIVSLLAVGPFVSGATNSPATGELFMQVSQVPLPPALLLFGSALVGLGFLGSRRRRSPGTQASAALGLLKANRHR